MNVRARFPSIFDTVIVTRGRVGASSVSINDPHAEVERFELGDEQRLFVRTKSTTGGIHAWARSAEDHDATADFEIDLAYANQNEFDEQGVQYVGVEIKGGVTRPVHVLLTRKDCGW